MNELFQNVLTASFHGSIVIAVVILLRLVLKKTPKKFFCLLWLLAGVRLLMPFEIQSSLSLQPDAASVVEDRWQQEEAAPDPASGFLMDGVMEPVVQGNDAPVFGNTPVVPVSSTPAVNVPAENAVPAASAPSKVEDKPAVDWAALVPYFWLAVAGCFALSSIYSYLRLKYQVREAIKIPGGWECEHIETAFILGFIKPQIYIPMGMSPSNRKYILAHERTHLEKGDHWFKMIGYLALAIHWFNPLVWAAYILLCKDIEMACDERVVQFMELEERKHYSAALLSCSTNRAHFAACPVAFGEVSVKSRIKSVLNYRKPSFWISLLGVIAIIFVAVCLVTSPVENGESPAAGETTPTEETVAVKENGFASNLSEREIAYTCEQAIEELKSRDTYCVQVVYGGESTSRHYGVENYTSMIRRHGEDTMSLYDESVSVGGFLCFNGVSASNWGDAWVKDDPTRASEPNAWLSRYSPSGKKVTFPEGTGVLSGDTVSFAAEWTEGAPFEEEYSGTFTFTFHEDGTLASFGADYVYVVGEEDGGGEVHYIQTATVLEEDPEETYDQIQSYAEQAVTQEELESIRREKQTVTEVPSNKTDYDKDFMLGSGQMGWQFMDGEWFFKFGAVDVTETSARLLIEYNGPYGNNTISSGTVTSGDTYFIEQLVDGTWVEVPVNEDNFTPIEKKSLPSGASQSINWESAYGKLPGGFYRIGNYYTFTSSTGETDTKVCYAKFRLYDPEMDTLLAKCRNGLSGLLASDSYHLLATDYRILIPRTSEDEPSYSTDELWKCGNDYLMDTCAYRDTGEAAWGSGLMRRNGTYYGLEWVGNSSRNDVSSWNTVTYPNEDNFQIWSWSYEFYDAMVYDVSQEGNSIHVLSTYDFDDTYAYGEIVYSFNEEGKLCGMTKAYLYENGDRVVDGEMVVFDDAREEIGAYISGQDLSTIATFSYAEDVAKYSNSDENVRTKNFVNTTAKTVSGPLDAIDIAIKDCTLPAAVGLEPGTNKSDAFYDAEAKMWKVEFTASWDSSIYQAVYINNQGITQMTVTLEQEANY